MNRLARCAKQLELRPESGGNQAREGEAGDGIIRGAFYGAFSGSSRWTGLAGVRDERPGEANVWRRLGVLLEEPTNRGGPALTKGGAVPTFLLCMPAQEVGAIWV